MMMRLWVVHKVTRSPGPASYAGTAWLGTKLRYEGQYRDRKYANLVAEALSAKSPVGFTVSIAAAGRE